MLAHVVGEAVVRVEGDRQHPLSRGYTCSKGRAIPKWHHSKDRISYPSVHGKRASWPICLDDLSETVRRLTDGGHFDRVAHYAGTGLYQDSLGWWAIARFFAALGSRQRYTSATVDIAPVYKAAELVTGYWNVFASWAPEDPSPLLTIFLGFHPCISYRKRGGELWVIDPRATRSAKLADHHVAPLPGTDIYILGWLVHEILASGYDSDELESACNRGDVARLKEAVQEFTLSRIVAASGVNADILLDLLASIRRHRKLAILPGTGISFGPHGILTDWLRWALLIITGSLDKDGGMRFNPSGYAPLEQTEWPAAAPEDGAFAEAPKSRPDLPSSFGERPAAAIVDEIEAREIQSLFVAGGNPLTAFPHPERVRRALGTLKLFAVLDAFNNELTRIATHVLPVTWQLERSDVQFGDRTQYTEAVVAPEGERKPIWWIFGQLAKRLDIEMFEGQIDVDTCTEKDVVNQFGRSARGGIEAVKAAGTHGLSVPFRQGWLHERVLPDGRWRLAPAVLVKRLKSIWTHDPASVRLVCGRVPDSNNSVHYFDQRHKTNEPPPILISPDIAARVDLSDGNWARIESTLGAVQGPVLVDSKLRPGVVWISHGWPQQNVASLTSGSNLDPLTGQPIQSAVPVTVLKCSKAGPPSSS